MELSKEAEALNEANVQLNDEARLNRALSEGEKVISPSEAEVYRQWNQLVIRLKKIAFLAGKAELPEGSKSTLTKTRRHC